MSPDLTRAIRDLPPKDKARLTARLQELRDLDTLMRQPGALAEVVTPR